MKTKSAYRLPRNIPAEEPADIPENIQPSESVKIDFDTNKAEPTPTVGVVNVADYPEPDEATLALQKQLADLKKSEQIQRDYAERMAWQAQQAQRPMSREEKVSAWRANHGDPDDIAFLEAHPEMIDRHDVTVVAAEAAAQQGFQRGTDDHRQATLELFNQHLGQQQAQPAGSVGPASTPAFFEPPPPSRSPAAAHEQRASIVSAPVSRGTASYETGQRPARQIKLSAEEQEYARVAGVSDVEYARQKQKLAQAKANGDYGERR